MKRLLIVIVSLFAWLLCFSQGKKAGLYYVYDFREEPSLTPAPEGYRPFYISHMGRHGARYATDEYDTLAMWLEKASSAGMLTGDGVRFKEDYDAFYKEAKYKKGNLTQMGAEQHKIIATRMARRFPQVLEGPTHIEAVATESPRVIMSMWSFLWSLRTEDPDITFHADASACYAYWLQPALRSNPYFIKGRPKYTQGMEEALEGFFLRTVPCGQIMRKFFTEPEAVCELAKSTPKEFIVALYKIICCNQCLDYGRDRFDGVLTGDEIDTIWKAEAARHFALLANFEGSESLFVDYAAFTLEQILDAAASDMASGDTQLRLRFAHDSGIMPLLAFMDVNGFGRKTSSLVECVDIFPDYNIPMGCSVQFVFFRNPEGDILVQVLLNEREVSLPIASVSGPFYRWQDVKAFYEPRIAASKARIADEKKRFSQSRKDSRDDLSALRNIRWDWKKQEGSKIETAAASVPVLGGMQHITLARFPIKAQHLSIVESDGPGAAATSVIASRSEALLAVNGSYFSKDRYPVTFVKDEGKVVPSVSVGNLRLSNGLLLIKDKKVDIEMLKDTLSHRQIAKSYREAIAAGPVLLLDGKAPDYDNAGIDSQFYKRFYVRRHPRTAVGYTQDGWLYLIVIDGRFRSIADGMSIKELQTLCQALGLYEAINLDGGGSSTFWTAGDGVLNHPCDNKVFDHNGERTVPNILIVQ